MNRQRSRFDLWGWWVHEYSFTTARPQQSAGVDMEHRFAKCKWNQKKFACARSIQSKVSWKILFRNVVVAGLVVGTECNLGRNSYYRTTINIIFGDGQITVKRWLLAFSGWSYQPYLHFECHRLAFRDVCCCGYSTPGGCFQPVSPNLSILSSPNLHGTKEYIILFKN